MEQRPSRRKRLTVLGAAPRRNWLDKLNTGIQGFIGALILRFLYATCSWEIRAEGVTPLPFDNPQPIIWAFWHGRQLFAPRIRLYPLGRQRSRVPTTIMSRHRDGRLIASVSSYLGIRSTPGSSSRGGTEALFGLLHALRKGGDAVITPDGPKGPPEKAKIGVAILAQRSGAPVYPVGLSATRVWRVSSWDRMMVPKPFAHCIICFGQPITVSENSEEFLERGRAVVEEALRAITEMADRATGQLPARDAGGACSSTTS